MTWILFALAMLAIAAPIVIERQRRQISRDMRTDAPGRFAKLTRGVTHYQWAGPQNGPRIVCIHGISSPSYVWTALVKGFVLMGFRVLTYDLYGHGLSARPEGKQDMLFFRQQLAELLEDQQVDDDVILVGYSLGGMIATDFTNAFPEKVQRLILLATAGLSYELTPFLRFVARTPIIGDGLIYAFGGKIYGRTARVMDAAMAAAPNLKPWPLEERRTQGFLPAVLSALRHSLSVDQVEIHRAIAQFDIPILAIWAEDDIAIPLSAMGRLAQVNRAARHEVIKGADHALPYTHPREIIATVQEFLREVA
jgi:pimeloyl-ACP methyl ester carboxylesterase